MKMRGRSQGSLGLIWKSVKRPQSMIRRFKSRSQVALRASGFLEKGCDLPDSVRSPYGCRTPIVWIRLMIDLPILSFMQTKLLLLLTIVAGSTEPQPRERAPSLLSRENHLFVDDGQTTIIDLFVNLKPALCKRSLR